MYRSRKVGFRAMRKGIEGRKKPTWLIPLASGTVGNDAARDNQFHTQAYYGPEEGAQNYSVWAFAITPELLGQGERPSVAGVTENSTTRLRVAGMAGKLHFQPLLPSGYTGNLAPDGNEALAVPTQLVGFVTWAWFKVKANSTNVTGANRTDIYPWTDWTRGAAENTSSQLFGPYQGLNIDTQNDLVSLDWRGRSDAMSMGQKMWRMSLRPSNNQMISGTGNEPTYYVDAPAVEIPLPKKLVCNIGRGEALGMYLTVGDLGQTPQAAGAPSFALVYPTMRIKTFELD